MILYRPVGQAEYDLIAQTDFAQFPPRLPEQPIFYPVLNQQYAHEIAEKWNKIIMIKDEKNNSIIEFRTIIFLEKYVKDSMSYVVNMLVFIITFITLFISVFQQLTGRYVNFLLLPLIILITVLIFKALPKDNN